MFKFFKKRISDSEKAYKEHKIRKIENRNIEARKLIKEYFREEINIVSCIVSEFDSIYIIWSKKTKQQIAIAITDITCVKIYMHTETIITTFNEVNYG